MNISLSPSPSPGGGGGYSRRRFLAGLATLTVSPMAHTLLPSPTGGGAGGEGKTPAIRLAAAWQAGHGHQVGILDFAESLGIRTAIDVPTRAHGLLVLSDGSVLAVARRPGNWLLRFSADGDARQWRWSEPARAFTGHVIADETRVYTTETDLETGAGLIGVRDIHTLEKRAEWPTFGVDPHELVWEGGGRILVANGGIPTRPESGRLKLDLDHMDSSLVRLNAQSGEGLGQWRLDDPRLSMRHLAWHGDTLGIALQAEHDDMQSKTNAPVLALFAGDILRTTETPMPLAGYGGSIAATGEGFAVACPRADGIGIFSATGAWQRFAPLEDACPLACHHAQLYAGGRKLAWREDGTTAALPALRLDNHWVAL